MKVRKVHELKLKKNMQKHMQMPTTRIGRLVGGRDHSTVLYSCSQIEKRLKTDKQFAKTMTLIENSFVKK